MEVLLGPDWKVSTEHPACVYGQPLLVNRKTDATYGPGYLVPTEPPGTMTAERVVLFLIAEYTGEIPDARAGNELLDRFRRVV